MLFMRGIHREPCEKKAKLSSCLFGWGEEHRSATVNQKISTILIAVDRVDITGKFGRFLPLTAGIRGLNIARLPELR